MSSPSRMTLVLLALAASSADGFTVAPTARPTTSLNLVPEQGKQLVAAFEAGSVHFHQDGDDTDEAIHHPGTKDEKLIGVIATKTNANKKSFVSRIFSIPGSIMGRHPAAAPALVDLPRENLSEGDDVVLYPIVGFQFVKGGHQALPTQTNAACRIGAVVDEEVFGWFTPNACQLDSIYSDTYCDKPKIEVEGEDVL